MNPDLQITQKYLDLGNALKAKGDFKATIVEMH
jgi:hypothetical protein